MYKNSVVTAMEQSERNVAFSMREAFEIGSSVEHICGQVNPLTRVFYFDTK